MHIRVFTVLAGRKRTHNNVIVSFFGYIEKSVLMKLCDEIKLFTANFEVREE